MINTYKPDLAAFERMDQRGKDAILRRNFELISKALNGLSPSQVVSTSGGGGGTTIVTADEDNFFVKIWQISKSLEIPVDEIYATTGIKLNGPGSLKVTGELKVI